MQEELWLTYKNTCKELEQLQEQAQLLRHRLLATSPFTTMTRVWYNDQVYYIYKSELWSAVSNYSDEPRYWLTLTKLRKDGSFPDKQLKSTYCNSNEVKVIGSFGDEHADRYIEKV
jgi:hypothetical protein